MSIVEVSAEIEAAVRAGEPVVAFESTVYSTLGLPEPHNRAVFAEANAMVRSAGAVPALTAVIDGRPTVGLDDPEAIFACDRKVAARDLAVAAAQRWPVGVTTVGASLLLAHHAGIAVFATGGIGGVHRNAAVTGDISNDLDMLATHPIVTVCAGAKSFLDLPYTLEALETRGVVVIGYRTDELPAFTALSSGLPVPYRVDEPAEIASILRMRRELRQGGVLVCVRPPKPLDSALLDQAAVEAEARADAAGVAGPARTPFVLAAIAELTDGQSVSANTALVANNAAVAAAIATHV